MDLEALTVSRYRSIQDASITLRQFGVLVGPNNAGKSNFVDGLDFLADVYRYGLELAVSRKGGFESLAFRRQRRTKAPVGFTSRVAMTVRDLRPYASRLPDGVTPQTKVVVTHSFGLQARRSLESDYRVTEEALEIQVPGLYGDEAILDIGRSGTGLSASVLGLEGRFWNDLLFPFNEQRIRKRLEREQTREGDLIVSSRGYVGPLLSRFSRFFGQVRVFQITAQSSRLPGSATPSPELGRYGTNLPAFVRYVSRTKAWSEILGVMRRIVPRLESIDTGFAFDRSLTLRFKEEGLARPWNASEMSDGTLQALALLCALHDPRSEVVIIEEPENSLHPWIIREFVSSARGVPDKQILLTTHSPTLLNELAPHEVFVVSRVDGATRIRPLNDVEPSTQSIWEKGGLGVFDMIDTGLVLPAVPLE